MQSGGYRYIDRGNLTQVGLRSEALKRRCGNAPGDSQPSCDSSLKRQKRGTTRRCPWPPQLSCLSPSPAGTGFCSPPGGRVPADWSMPVSSPHSANQRAAVFSSWVGIKALE